MSYKYFIDEAERRSGRLLRGTCIRRPYNDEDGIYLEVLVKGKWIETGGSKWWRDTLKEISEEEAILEQI